MSMVFLPCPRCGDETAAWITEHTDEDCDAQLVENARQRVAHEASNAAWAAKLAALDAAGLPRPPQIKLPEGRVVTPRDWVSTEVNYTPIEEPDQ